MSLLHCRPRTLHRSTLADPHAHTLVSSVVTLPLVVSAGRVRGGSGWWMRSPPSTAIVAMGRRGRPRGSQRTPQPHEARRLTRTVRPPPSDTDRLDTAIVGLSGPYSHRLLLTTFPLLPHPTSPHLTTVVYCGHSLLRSIGALLTMRLLRCATVESFAMSPPLSGVSTAQRHPPAVWPDTR